jgi:multiple sugar transport system ATP-binding protein
MNVVQGTVKRANGNAWVDAEGARWPVPSNTAATDGEPVSYGIRPEHLAFGGGADSVQAEIVVVEPTGAETEFVLKVGASELLLRTHGRPAVAPGDRVALSINPADAHLFDQKSGMRVGT